MMLTKHALYLTDTTLIYATVDKSGVELIFTQETSEPDFEESCSDFIEQLNVSEISVFLDLIGEEYKHESVPHVSGKDRELLIERKQKSLFPSADLAWKSHIEREKTGRKDDAYLLMGIQLPHAVKAVFDLLIKNKQEVTGVYSISILESEIQQVMPSVNQHLTVSRVLGKNQSNRSYRQTFSKNKEIDISRVTRAKGNDFDEVLGYLMDEIERMHHFLNGSKKLDGSHTLSVIAALGEKENQQLLTKTSNINIKFKFFDLYELAQKLGLNKPRVVSSLPEVLINLALVKKVKPHFKPVLLCAEYKKGLVRKTIRKVIIASVVFALVASMGLSWKIDSEVKAIAALEAQISDLKHQKEGLVLEVQGGEIRPLLMKNVVQLYQNISQNQYAPDEVLTVFAKAYRGFYDVSIMGINWLSEKSNSELNEENNSEPFVDSIKAPKRFSLQISLPSTMSDREVINRVNSFSTSLLEQAEILSVTQESGAVDTKSSSSMERSMSANSQNEKPIEFTLLITMKLS